MLAQSRPLDVDKVAPFGEEVANEGALDDRQTAIDLLAWFCDQTSDKEDATAGSRLPYMLHEPEPVKRVETPVLGYH